MISFLKKQSVQISLVILVLSGIGFLAHKATNKENTQHIIVEEGGVATINTSVQQDEKLWSVGGLIAKDTSSKGMIFGMTFTRRF